MTYWLAYCVPKITEVRKVYAQRTDNTIEQAIEIWKSLIWIRKHSCLRQISVFYFGQAGQITIDIFALQDSRKERLSSYAFGLHSVQGMNQCSFSSFLHPITACILNLCRCHSNYMPVLRFYPFLTMSKVLQVLQSVIVRMP